MYLTTFFRKAISVILIFAVGVGSIGFVGADHRVRPRFHGIPYPIVRAGGDSAPPLQFQSFASAALAVPANVVANPLTAKSAVRVFEWAAALAEDSSTAITLTKLANAAFAPEEESSVHWITVQSVRVFADRFECRVGTDNSSKRIVSITTVVPSEPLARSLAGGGVHLLAISGDLIRQEPALLGKVLQELPAAFAVLRTALDDGSRFHVVHIWNEGKMAVLIAKKWFPPKVIQMPGGSVRETLIIERSDGSQEWVPEVSSQEPLANRQVPISVTVALANDESPFNAPRPFLLKGSRPNELLRQIYFETMHGVYEHGYGAPSGFESITEAVLDLCRIILDARNAGSLISRSTRILAMLNAQVLPRVDPAWRASLPDAREWPVFIASESTEDRHFSPRVHILAHLSFRSSLLFWLLNGIHKRSTVNAHSDKQLIGSIDTADAQADRVIFARLLRILIPAMRRSLPLVDGIPMERALRGLRNGVAVPIRYFERMSPEDAAGRYAQDLLAALPESLRESAADIIETAFHSVSNEDPLPTDLCLTWPSLGFGTEVILKIVEMNGERLAVGQEPLSALLLLTDPVDSHFYKRYAVPPTQWQYDPMLLHRTVKFLQRGFRKRLQEIKTAA